MTENPKSSGSSRQRRGSDGERGPSVWSRPRLPWQRLSSEGKRPTAPDFPARRKKPGTGGNGESGGTGDRPRKPLRITTQGDPGGEQPLPRRCRTRLTPQDSQVETTGLPKPAQTTRPRPMGSRRPNIPPIRGKRPTSEGGGRRSPFSLSSRTEESPGPKGPRRRFDSRNSQRRVGVAPSTDEAPSVDVPATGRPESGDVASLADLRGPAREAALAVAKMFHIQSLENIDRVRLQNALIGENRRLDHIVVMVERARESQKGRGRISAFVRKWISSRADEQQAEVANHTELTDISYAQLSRIIEQAVQDDPRVEDRCILFLQHLSGNQNIKSLSAEQIQQLESISGLNGDLLLLFTLAKKIVLIYLELRQLKEDLDQIERQRTLIQKTIKKAVELYQQYKLGIVIVKVLLKTPAVRTIGLAAFFALLGKLGIDNASLDMFLEQAAVGIQELRHLPPGVIEQVQQFLHSGGIVLFDYELDSQRSELRTRWQAVRLFVKHRLLGRDAEESVASVPAST